MTTPTILSISPVAHLSVNRIRDKNIIPIQSTTNITYRIFFIATSSNDLTINISYQCVYPNFIPANQCCAFQYQLIKGITCRIHF